MFSVHGGRGTQVSGHRSLLGKKVPLSLVPGSFQGRGGQEWGAGTSVSDPRSLWRKGVLHLGPRQGYPLPLHSPHWTEPGQGYIPPSRTQHSMDRIRCGRYASCGHTGRLSCKENYLSEICHKLNACCLIHSLLLVIGITLSCRCHSFWDQFLSKTNKKRSF